MRLARALVAGLIVLASAQAVRGTTAPESTAGGNADLAQRFLAECAARAEAADGMAVQGSNGWLFLRSELRHLGVGRFWGADAERTSLALNPAHADPLPAILHYRDELARAGIDLLLLPVPPKAIVYPDELSDLVDVAEGATPPRLDVHHQEFYALLREQGVDVLDLVPLLTARRDGERGPAWCRQDSHWSGQGCLHAARAVRDHVQSRFEGLERTPFASASVQVTIAGDLLGTREDGEPALEALWLRQAAETPATTSRDSPIILLGDSHSLVFHAGGDMHAPRSGLPDQLAIELGLPVDLIGVRGSGARPARIALLRRASAAGYLEGKKLLVWCFAARELTEATGWGNVPVKW